MDGQPAYELVGVSPSDQAADVVRRLTIERDRLRDALRSCLAIAKDPAKTGNALEGIALVAGFALRESGVARPATMRDEIRKINERKLRGHLRDLSQAVSHHLLALDNEMRNPSGNGRGRRVAKLVNQLELANDRVRYFALGVDYRTDRKTKR